MAEIICGSCEQSKIPNIRNVSFIQDKSIGCGLIVDFRKHIKDFKRLPHPESNEKKFKTGKLYCLNCGNDLGNIQIWRKREMGFLKFANIRFKVGAITPLKLSAKDFRQIFPNKTEATLSAGVLTSFSATTTDTKAEVSTCYESFENKIDMPLESEDSHNKTVEYSCNDEHSSQQIQSSSALAGRVVSGAATAAEGKDSRAFKRGVQAEAASSQSKASSQGQAQAILSMPRRVSCSGKVVSIKAEKQLGRIRLNDVASAKEVSFHFSRVVRAGSLPLCHGDIVEVELSSRRDDENYLQTQRVTVLELVIRSLKDLAKFINRSIDTLDDSIALSLTSSPPFWELLSRPLYYKISGLSCTLLNALCVIISRGKLRSALPDLLSANITIISHCDDRTTLYSLLQYVADIVPHRLFRLLPAVHDRFSVDNETIALLAVLARKASLGCISHDGDVSNLSWQQLPLLPSPAEFDHLEWTSELPLVKKTGAYASLDDFLEVIFRLEREDCFYPLREGIRSINSLDVGKQDISLYSAALKGVIVDAYMGVLALFTFQPLMRTKRRLFMFGSLICFSTDSSFKNLIYATVVNHEKNIVIVEFCNSDALSTILMTMRNAENIAAIESPVYHRAHMPVMQSLRRITSLSFEDELVFQRPPAVTSPARLDMNTPADEVFRLFGLKNEEDDDEYVLCDFLNFLRCDISLQFQGRELDESQKAALLHALENRVALIQGPPGTGKSFIGVVLVHVLLALGIEKIMIVSYKNHILNEMLTDLIQLPVVRIGGGGKDVQDADSTVSSNETKLDERNLRNLVRNGQKSSSHLSMQKDAEKRTNQAKKDMDDAVAALGNALFFNYERTTAAYMPPEQLDSLLSGMKWSTEDEQHLISLRHPDLKLSEFVAVSLPSDTTGDLLLLQDHLRELVGKAAREWFPKKDFENLRQSTAGIGILETLSGKTDLETAPAVDETEEAEEDFERKASAGSTRKFQELLKAQVKFGAVKSSSGENGNVAVLNQLTELEATVLLQQDDIWALSRRQRVFLVYAILKRQYNAALEEFATTYACFKELQNELARLDEAAKLAVLEESKVIGMTLDGQAINADLIERWGPQVVLVEESAECPFPKVLACLHHSVSHLVQIGDPKQLPPQINAHHLVKRNFNMSMMEVMMNNLPSTTLTRQGRMPSNFRMLLQDIYPDLLDNESAISKLAPVDCIESSMFWWSHDFSHEKNNSTYVNTQEAKMVTDLVTYLLVQGVSASQITVLAAYRGQVNEIKKSLQRISEQTTGVVIADVEVHTIDRFQGDENDFIIVSLVKTGVLQGFLAGRQGMQRRCVAQSRARRGLYFVADHKAFIEERSWAFLVRAMDSVDCLSSHIPLVCPRHPQSRRRVCSTDPMPISSSICGLRCKLPMECGVSSHLCEKPCHGGAVLHSASVCRHKVEYTCQSRLRHHLFRMCCEVEKACMTSVEFMCPVGHVQRRACSVAECDVPCTSKVPYSCTMKHEVARECWLVRSGEPHKCTFKCERLLQCSHPCPRQCFEECLSAADCQICHRAREEAEKIARDIAKERYRLMLVGVEEELALPDAALRPLKCDISSDGETASEYWEVHDKVIGFMKDRAMLNPYVTRLVRVSNLKRLKIFYEAAMKSHDPTNMVLRPHLCNEESAEQAIRDGFPVESGSAGRLGRGMYFSSAVVTNDESSGFMVVCEVLLGKPYTLQSAEVASNLKKKLFQQNRADSVFIPRSTDIADSTDRHYVYDSSQVIVKYLVYYELVKIGRLPVLWSTSQTLVRHRLEPRRAYNPDDPHDIHFRIAESQFLRLCSRRRLQFVELIENPVLMRKWDAKREEFKKKGKDDVVLAFHATRNPDAITNIITNNFDTNRIGSATDSGWWGRGFYFSEFPDVSLSYGHNLLLCQLLPGKTFDVTVRMDGKPLTPGYDSHRLAKDAMDRGQELVIPEPDQVLPLYVLHVE